MGTRPHSECDNVMRSIQNYHMDSQGWSDIAYSLCVCEHGYIFEGRGQGKGPAANGTTQANADYYAVCALVGENDPQPAALDTGIADAAAKCRSWGAGSAVKGHRDFVATSCPGDELYGKVKAGRYSGGTAPPSGGGGGQLDVDGWLGSATISEWQRIMGTPVDGVISRPSLLVKEVQKHLNSKGMRDAEGQSLVVDGYGIASNEGGRYPESGTTDTIESLQRYLDTTMDGYFSAPSSAVKALQKRLNTGKF